MPQLSKDIAITWMIASTEVAAGTTATESSVVLDMAGYDGVLFLDCPHTVTAAGARYICAMSGDSSGTMAANSNLAGTTGTASTTGLSSAVIALDVYKPISRFVSVKQVRATQNSGGGVLAIQYKNRVGPISQTTAYVFESLTVLGLDT